MSTLEEVEAKAGSINVGSETELVQDIVDQEAIAYQQEQSFADDVQDVQENPISIDHEAEARKFQSMYDRAQSENARLKRLEPVAELLEKRPDLVQKLQEGIATPQSSKESQPGINKDDFNPWDAYTEEGSVSNQHVKNQMQQVAGGMIQNAMAEQQRQMQADMQLNNTVNTLRETYKMADAEIQDFIQFTTQPKEAVGMGNLVKLWRDVNGTQVAANDTMEAVNAAKQAPRTAGVLQGQAPTSPKNSQDKAWDSVLKTGSGARLP